jgi:hypothetical protein
MGASVVAPRKAANEFTPLWFAFFDFRSVTGRFARMSFSRIHLSQPPPLEY